MSELGEFLRSRRAALTPEEAGVATFGTPRRVPGLRREEAAMLVGISVNYYTRIEQGRSRSIRSRASRATPSPDGGLPGGTGGRG